MKRRTRLEEGIYEDAYGIAATVKVGKVQREGRWPHGTDREIIRSWRIQKRAELDKDRAETPEIPRGTLRRDGDRWIERKKGMPCYPSDRSHLHAWYPKLGPMMRLSITREHVETVIAEWRSASVAARTLRHRVRVLRELYHALDGERAPTPVDAVSLGVIPPPEPRAVSARMIKTVATKLKTYIDGLEERIKRKPKNVKQLTKRWTSLRRHYARFLVRATTGQRPALIGRALETDVDLKRRIWFVRSGKGGNPIPLPLNADMIAAWKYFAQADAWGAFDTPNAAKRLQTYGWPKHIRPYDLRHTFAIDHLMLGADLGDLQGLLGHRQIQTTRKHYAPILTARLRHVTAKRRLKLP